MTKANFTKPRAGFSIERTYAGSLDEVWDLWTTQAGIESWWGSEGFQVAVLSMELKPGGHLVYRMTATGPQQVEFMKRHGMPLATDCKVTYVEVSPPHRLAYTTLADFVPGLPAYDVTTVVELRSVAEGVRLTVTSEAMHDDVWTERARAGLESQLRKLDARMAAGRAARP